MCCVRPLLDSEPQNLTTSGIKTFDCRWNYRPFFLAAHRAFINLDSFFLAAGLIGLRFEAAFLAGISAFLGADLPFRWAHLSFIAAEILARAAALMVLFPPDFGGRPRRAGTEPSPTSALMAFSMRRTSSLSSFMML